MSHIVNPLVWTLFIAAAAVSALLLGRMILASLSLFHDLAVLSESPETFDDDVGKVRRPARRVLVGLLVSGGLVIIAAILAVAVGPLPAGLLMAAAAVSVYALERLHVPLENRAKFLLNRYTSGKRKPAETIQPPFIPSVSR